MARFTIYSPRGVQKAEGYPTFTGTYMKPGVLDFREVASPSPIFWEIGDYVDYRGTRYYLFDVPQAKRQAYSHKYGGAIVYQNVQFRDASYYLEICHFRDLVAGDNRIHFSTQPSISVFDDVAGIAERIQACLDNMYPGEWLVRLANNPEYNSLMQEEREFTVSGVSIIGALEQVYETWPEVGWIFTREKVTINGQQVLKNVITIAGAGLNLVDTYSYGKGNGLTSITRTPANASEFANRLYVYGSNRNMLPRWYNGKQIKDKDSVDIQHLMLPVEAIPAKDYPGWGKTTADGSELPDPAKAFIQPAVEPTLIRPKAVYFDGSGDYKEIYPTIREMTIGEIRAAKSRTSDTSYVPDASIYQDSDERVDRVLSVQGTFDSGLSGKDNKNTIFTDYKPVYVSAGVSISPGYASEHISILTESFTFTSEEAGNMNPSFSFEIEGYVRLEGIETAKLTVYLRKGHPANSAIMKQKVELAPGPSAGDFIISPFTFSGTRKEIVADTYYLVIDLEVTCAVSAEARMLSYVVSGDLSASLERYREKTFKMVVRQIGFDISEQANLGDGKTLAMRSGKCSGRTFKISSCTYQSATDSWLLEVIRSNDDSLSQWFPNADYPVRGKSANYEGDEFVLLDIAMPALYVSIAEERLLDVARELLADVSVQRWQYTPDIDAKFMIESGRSIRAGDYLIISDDHITVEGDDENGYLRTDDAGNPYYLTSKDEKILLNSGVTAKKTLVDSVSISEGESPIPTYKVTMRDRKRKSYSDKASVAESSSTPVATPETVVTRSTSTADSFFEEDGNGAVKLRDEYQGLWANGFGTFGGVNPGGGGGGGGGIDISRLWESLTDTTRDGTAPFGPDNRFHINPAHIPTISVNGDASGTVTNSYTGSTHTGGININLSIAKGNLSILDTGTDTTPMLWSPYVLSQYVAQKVASATSFKGGFNASSGAIDGGGTLTSVAEKVGDVYTVTTAGTFAGTALEVGDSIIFKADCPAGTAPTSAHVVFVEGTVSVTNNQASLAANQHTALATVEGVGITARIEVTNSTATLSPGVAATIASVAGQDISITLPNLYLAGTAVATSAAQKTIFGVTGISNALTQGQSDDSLIVWEPQYGAWHFKGNIYADGFITAGGVNGGGGGGDLDLGRVWQSLRSNSETSFTNAKIHTGHLPILTANDGLTANYSVTVDGNNLATETRLILGISSIDMAKVSGLSAALAEAGKVKSISVNSQSYTPNASGVITLPNYSFGSQATDSIPITLGSTTKSVLTAHQTLPTTLPNPNALTIGSKTYDGSSAVSIVKADITGLLTGTYLPLAGGTMDNTNLVTNMNADLLDGQHKSYYDTLKCYYGDIKSANNIQYPAALLNQDTPSTTFWYVFTTYYTTVGGNNYAQFALSYQQTNPDMYIRQVKSGTATNWVKLYNTTNLTKAVVTGLIGNDTYHPYLGSASLAFTANGLTATKIYLSGNNAQYLEYDSIAGSWHLVGNLYVDGYVTAGGVNPGGGSTIDLNRVWESLTNNTDKPNVKINVAHIPDLAMSKITGLAEALEEAGKVKSISVNSQSYTPNASGVITLPNYSFGTQATDSIPITLGSTTKSVLTSHQTLPTTLPNPNALTIGGKAYDGSSAVSIVKADITGLLTGTYLPLAGGTMTAGALISWGDNDVADWSSLGKGMMVLSSIVTDSGAPTRYCTALHVKGRYGFDLASQGGDYSNFFIRNSSSTEKTWYSLYHTGNLTKSVITGLLGNQYHPYQGSATLAFTAKTISIASTTAEAHLSFAREGLSYIKVPENGSLGIVANSAVGGANSTVIFGASFMRPGSNGGTALGYYANASAATDDRLWSNVASQGMELVKAGGATLYIRSTTNNGNAGSIIFRSYYGERNGFKIASEGASANRQSLNFYASNNETSPYEPVWKRSMRISYNGNVIFGDKTSGSEFLPTVYSYGNLQVGDGTANPTALLSVLGDAMVSTKLYLGGNTSSHPYMEWDATNNAWHLTGNFYADGFITAGGIGSTNTQLVTLAGTQTISGKKTFTGTDNTFTKKLLLRAGLKVLTVTSSGGTTTTTEDIVIERDSQGYNHITSANDRLYIQKGTGQPLILCNGAAKCIVGTYPGDFSQKFYVNGDAYIEDDLTINGICWATDYQYTSDARLKDDIRDITKEFAIEKLMMFRPVTWTWNEKSSLHGRVSAGLVAQEVEKFLPQMVSEGKYKGLNYNLAHAIEICALQDHERRIARLEKENNELKRRLGYA